MLGESKGASMAEIDEAAVLTRGKALAARDGFTWEIDFNSPPEGRASFRGMHFLSEERRQEYLARAHDELRHEADNA
jgi:hypothetical protein